MDQVVPLASLLREESPGGHDALGALIPGNAPASPEPIKELSHTHLSFMDWILENPEKGLKEMSAYYGYTMSWLSRVINSDIFQAKLAERRKDIELRICDDIPTRLRGLGQAVIEKMEEQLQNSQDPRFIRESFDSIMHRIGYAPSGKVALSATGPVQINQFVVSREELQAMQGRILHAGAGTPELPVRSSAESSAIPVPLDPVPSVGRGGNASPSGEEGQGTGQGTGHG